MTRLYRASQADLEIRGGDGRTIYGLAVPFDTPTEIRELGRSYIEVFKRGAFAKTLRERGDKVKVLALHNRRELPLGRAQRLEEDAAGLLAELRVSKTSSGDEVLELVRDGALDSLSIGFTPIKSVDRPPASRGDPPVVERREVALHEISVTPFPAYDGAQIAGVRHDQASTSVETWRKRLDLAKKAYT